MENLLSRLNTNSEKKFTPQVQASKKSPEELKQLRINNLKKTREKSSAISVERSEKQKQLNTTEKKRRTKTEINNSWTRDHKLVSVDPPIEYNGKQNSRYSISFKYYSPEDKKIKKRSVKFGDRNKEYFIHHQDETRNKKMMSNFKAYYSPFHKNFWILSLLCSESTINKAYTKLLENLFK